MRRTIVLIFLFLSSCKNNVVEKKVLIKTDIELTHFDSLLIDTPKILKGGKDYFITATSKYDAKYFGKRFAPYKLEVYDVAQIERMLDSLIEKEQQNVAFKEKSITSFRYVFYSAVTSNKNLEARIVGFNKTELKCWKLNVHKEFLFSIIYDLIKNRILSFKTIEK